MGYAFISYSSKNQSYADALRDLLNSRGIDTWMAPGDIPIGSSYMKEINNALKNCSCFVLLVSNASQGSQWVIKELERAVHYYKTIIPVQIEDVILNDEFEFVLGSCQVIAIQKIDKDSREINNVINTIIVSTGVNQKENSDNTDKLDYQDNCLKSDRNKESSDNIDNSDNQYICLISVKNTEERFVLEYGMNIIGTNPRKATVVLNNKYVSGVHAAINISKQSNTIKNLNAVNGTYLNGKRLDECEEKELFEGNIVKFGEESFLFLC